MNQASVEACPRCKSNHAVRSKKILIGAASPTVLLHGEEKAGYTRKDQLAIDECVPSALGEAPMQQFVDGWYCERCGAGFVSEDIKGKE